MKISLPTVDLLNSFPRSLVSSSLPGVGMRTSSQSVILQHNYISLLKSCPPLVYVTLSSVVLLLTP